MKRFKFTLEAVRKIRRQEEQLVQIELATAMREQAVVADQLATSRQAELDLYEWMRTSALSGASMAHVSQYGTLHRQRIFDTEVQLMHLDERVDRVRERLIDARARREALDKLRERELERHRNEMLAEESRELDEIATLRHGHGIGVSAVMSGGVA
jgi:flagellar FliJ protein